MLFERKRPYQRVFKNLEEKFSVFEDRILSFENIISALEAEVARLRLANTVVTPKQVDAALRVLGEKMKDGRPHFSYFNIRFRSVEVALMNIKALANELGQRLYKERLERSKVGPPPPAQNDVEALHTG